MIYEDDQEALAAEYVLGTLDADERAQAQALIGIDSGFGMSNRAQATAWPERRAVV